MKENARKLLAKVGITRSFPNGKRSVNAGIHAKQLDSAVFTVSENTGKRPQKAGFHSLTAVNSRFFRLKTQGKCRNTRRSPSVNRSVIKMTTRGEVSTRKSVVQSSCKYDVRIG